MSTGNNNQSSEHGSGYLEISEKGFGFLRTSENHFHPKPTDIFVTPDTIKRSFLREGSVVEGPLQAPHRGSSPQLRSVQKVNGMAFEDYTKAVRFENLTTIDPIEKFKLETTPDLLETRVIDLVTPIGRGTRGLIVSPPRSGKTTVLKQLANAIVANHPDVQVMVLLIDERPEEVTDFQRSVKAEVVASSNDQDLETHVRLSRFMIERKSRRPMRANIVISRKPSSGPDGWFETTTSGRSAGNRGRSRSASMPIMAKVMRASEQPQNICQCATRRRCVDGSTRVSRSHRSRA